VSGVPNRQRERRALGRGDNPSSSPEDLGRAKRDTVSSLRPRWKKRGPGRAERATKRSVRVMALDMGNEENLSRPSLDKKNKGRGTNKTKQGDKFKADPDFRLTTLLRLTRSKNRVGRDTNNLRIDGGKKDGTTRGVEGPFRALLGGGG